MQCGIFILVKKRKCRDIQMFIYIYISQAPFNWFLVTLNMLKLAIYLRNKLFVIAMLTFNLSWVHCDLEFDNALSDIPSNDMNEIQDGSNRFNEICCDHFSCVLHLWFSNSQQYLSISHCGIIDMAALLQMTFSNGFPLKKMFVIWFKFHEIFIPKCAFHNKSALV